MVSPLQTSSAQTVALPMEDGLLYEIVDGHRVDVPPMSAYATWIASRLHSRLSLYTEEQALGTSVMEMLFILGADRDLRRRPDVAFVSAARWPLDRALPEIGDWAVVPDLAVEVISPNDVLEDVLTKLREYFHYGVQFIWLVLPEARQVYVYESPLQVRILAADEVLGCDQLFPGFRLPVASLFQRSRSAAVR